MHPQKPRTFSNVTPIQPGTVTIVDLGDTTRTLGPIVAQPQQLQLSKDQPLPFTTAAPVGPVPMIDLKKMIQPRE